MNEQFADVGRGITLCYETFGDPADPALVLVMGLGTQMIGWHEDFCTRLAGRGFFVVRFDNRDNGRSTHLSHHRPPKRWQLVLRDKRAAAYTLDDMADDLVGLLDALGIGRAHLVGASMGGMIAQTVAARHPERVLSLCSIMSTTGARRYGQPSPRIWSIFLRRPPARDPSEFAEHTVRLWRQIGSHGFERDEDEIRRRALLSLQRGGEYAGVGRQTAAVIASGDRTERLRSIVAPTLVIHGNRDLMVHPSGGKATARAIPGARLMTIEGMGHDLPRGAWDRMMEAIVENAARGQAADQPAQRSTATSITGPAGG